MWSPTMSSSSGAGGVRRRKMGVLRAGTPEWGAVGFLLALGCENFGEGSD